jgi:hypothetical protein
MKIIFEIIFLCAILGIADIQAGIIARGQAIQHLWWGLLFALLIAGAWWLEERDYWFAGALVLEHFVFFSPALNLCRKPRESFFYIHSDPKNGSIWDRLLKPVEKYYPFIWAAGLIVFGLVQIKL